MKKSANIPAALALICCSTITNVLAMDPFSLTLDPLGQLTWTNPTPAGCVFQVESTGSLGAPWSPLTNIFVTSPGADAAVPIGPFAEQYFRVAALTNVGFQLRAYYPCSGDTRDASPNGNDGVLHGAYLTADRFGNPNSACSVGGTSDWISASDSASLDIAGDVTIAVWVFPRSIHGDLLFVHKVNAYGLQYRTVSGGADTDGLAFLFSNDSSGSSWTTFTTAIQLQTNQWQHIAGTYSTSSGECRFYVNGAFVSDGGFIQKLTIPNSSGPLAIGGYNTVKFFDGLVDEVRVYGRTLSAEEITQLWTLAL